ncbi:MAG TPA: carboxypeptidase-like regulatory domain-containing protein, partial [Flavisolibacter sp.]|nr:carboxypeptidase-like regulatory domain-containing protein [Flavisolibacter sp.]
MQHNEQDYGLPFTILLFDIREVISDWAFILCWHIQNSNRRLIKTAFIITFNLKQMGRLLIIMLGMFVFSARLYAQNRTVTGRVTDEKGGVVQNASVVLKGTNIGTTTTSDGTFSISVPENAKILVVSYVGLGEAEVPLTGNANYNVVLSTSSRNLQEVVVVGYGSQRRTNVTGAIGSVPAAAIENKPFTSVDKALQGSV